MKTKFSVAILSLAALFGGSAAFAANVPSPSVPTATNAFAIKAGAYLRSADGRRIGVIDGVDTARNGSPLGAQVIIDSRVVHVPASTISGADKDHFTTNLSYKDVSAL